MRSGNKSGVQAKEGTPRALKFAATPWSKQGEPESSRASSVIIRAPLAAIDGRTATATHAPIPLVERVDPHVLPLIEVVLQIVEAGMQGLAG